MAESIIREWLAEYKGLGEGEVHSFASSSCQSGELVQALVGQVLGGRELLEPVCHQLFSFCRCAREPLLQLFALQFAPSLVGLYLSAAARSPLDIKNLRCVEVLLLSIYNLEVLDSNGKPKVHTFRIPSVSKPSVFHEPMSLSQPALTENALSRLEVGDTVSFGPNPVVEKINASNRLDVLTVVLRVYNQHAGQLSPTVHAALCKTASRLARQGYSRPPAPRVPLSAPFMLELLQGVYFALFNGAASAGLQALDDLHARATQELLPSVLLATTAVRNSLRGNSDGPMGLAVSLSPSASSQAVATAPGKGLITNASFRTKKLPDDIPIMREESKDGLTSIQEEGGGGTELAAADKKSSSKARRGSTSSVGSSSLLQIIKPAAKPLNGTADGDTLASAAAAVRDTKILFQPNHTIV